MLKISAYAFTGVELCTSTTVFKYWKGIAPSSLNHVLTPSLNNYNTKLWILLNIPLCRTDKGQKSISFLGTKIWNKVTWNIKTAVTTAYFTLDLKKEILDKLKDLAIFFFFLTVYCFYFTIFLCIHTSRGTLMKITTVLDLFYVIPAIFNLNVFLALCFSKLVNDLHSAVK